MIEVTRIDGTKILINPRLIESVVDVGDCRIIRMKDKPYRVTDSYEELKEALS